MAIEYGQVIRKFAVTHERVTGYLVVGEVKNKRQTVGNVDQNKDAYVYIGAKLLTMYVVT